MRRVAEIHCGCERANWGGSETLGALEDHVIRTCYQRGRLITGGVFHADTEVDGHRTVVGQTHVRSRHDRVVREIVRPIHDDVDAIRISWAASGRYQVWNGEIRPRSRC